VRLLVPILVILAGSIGWLWWSTHHRAGPAAWQGYVEADFVDVAPVEGGVVTALSVKRGDKVVVGAPLFRQDDVAERSARDQAAHQLAQAEMQLKNLEAGGKPTEIAQAEANLQDNQAAMKRTAADLDRDAAMLRRGVASAQVVDQRLADFRSAKAKFDAAAAALAQQEHPLGRADEIRAQRALVAAQKAALAVAQWRLDQRTVAAPSGGRVADILAQPGEMVPAGTAVVSLLPPPHIFVRFFVPEAALSQIRYGEQVAFGCDGCRPDLVGHISFISPTAEYTPPVIYSETTRAKLVFRIEARPPPDEAASLNPGQPVDVRPLAPRPAR
jgi:HlyD family secretion protein